MNRQQAYDNYLQSEQWQLIRVACYAKHERKCSICLNRNQVDCHHWRYPLNIWETQLSDVYPLCRACHKKVHRAGTWRLTRAEMIARYRGKHMNVPQTPAKPPRYGKPRNRFQRRAEAAALARKYRRPS